MAYYDGTRGGVLFKFILALWKFILLRGRAFSQHEVLFDWVFDADMASKMIPDMASSDHSSDSMIIITQSKSTSCCEKARPTIK